MPFSVTMALEQVAREGSLGKIKYCFLRTGGIGRAGRRRTVH